MKKNKISNKTKYAAALVIILAFVLLHLYIQTKSITLKYEVTNLKIKLKEIKSKNRMLAADLSKEESLNKIEKTAKEELGMDYPANVNYIVRKEVSKK